MQTITSVDIEQYANHSLLLCDIMLILSTVLQLKYLITSANRTTRQQFRQWFVLNYIWKSIYQ